MRKLQYAEVAITNLYVDSVDEKKLVEDAIRGMIDKLDPHSSYLTPKEVKSLNEPLNGNFEGIGVQFNMIEDTLLVIQPVTERYEGASRHRASRHQGSVEVHGGER